MYSFVNRYLELVHPMWHKTHFKKNWMFISFVSTWIFGIALKASHIIPTAKVTCVPVFLLNRSNLCFDIYCI